MLIVIFIKTKNGCTMKKLIIIIPTLLLTACATTAVKFNTEFAGKNLAIIEDTVYDPIFAINPENATVTSIDGKETEWTSTSNKISGGKHLLNTKCSVTKAGTLVFYGNNEIKVNLKAGHTYKLIPALKRPPVRECVSIIKDITKI